MTLRSPDERREAAVHRLETEANVWVATASDQGSPHLIPLSLAWDGSRVVVATPTASPTVRNARRSGRARVSLDDAADVVLIDGTVEVIEVPDAEPELIDLHRARVGWSIPEPRRDWSFLVITPSAIHAWNGPAEITGRTIMRGGVWI